MQCGPPILQPQPPIDRYTWASAWVDSEHGQASACTTDTIEAIIAGTANGTNTNKVNGFYRRQGAVPCFQPAEMYAASLHFAVMTVTSIGYGDIVGQNLAERFFICFLMMCSGMLW